MLYDIIDAKYVDDYRIKVRFEDDKEGIIDFKGYAGSGGVFARLKDINYFKQFSLNRELGTITWPNGADVAPETLYLKIQGGNK